MRLCFLLLIPLFFVSISGHTLTLNEYLNRFLDENAKNQVAVEPEFAPLVNPFSEFEYTYERKYLDRPIHEQGTDIFTLNFKSFSELKYTLPARRLTRDLIQKTRAYQKTATILTQFLNAIDQLIEERKKDLALSQKPLIDRYMNQQKNLASADSKTLRQILDMQMKAEIIGLQINENKAPRSSVEERILLIQQLIKKTFFALNSLKNALENSEQLALEKAELELDRIEDAINSDSGFNGITHFEIRQDRNNNFETEYRVGFSLPLDINTDEDYRKRALRSYREAQLTIQQESGQLESKQKIKELHILSREIEILNRQIKNLKDLKKIKTGKIAFSAQMIAFESEIALLDKIKDFYSLYSALLQVHKLNLDDTHLLGAN